RPQLGGPDHPPDVRPDRSQRRHRPADGPHQALPVPGTVGAAVTAVGMFLLSEISVHSTQLEVTTSLVFVGIGLGVTMPLYIQAVQSAVDRKFLGVVTSNIQFFRNVGGTIATAIFGSILASR